ncbi:MAG: hypothetical protein PVF83_11505 [Anaerolineales bacterium]|jgi:hypothetical protein
MSVERKEGKPGRFTFERVVSKAREFTLKEGGHIPVLIAQGSAGNVVMGMEIPPEFRGERFDLMFAAGMEVAIGNRVGQLEEVFFVSEGWMSVAEEKPPMVPPSRDPKRIEVLQITGIEITRDDRVQMQIFEMIRDRQGSLVDLTEFEGLKAHYEEGRAESPLLAAFLDGYRKGTGAPQN